MAKALPKLAQERPLQVLALVLMFSSLNGCGDDGQAHAPSIGACDDAIQSAYDVWSEASRGGSYTFVFRQRSYSHGFEGDDRDSFFVYRNVVKDGALVGSQAIPGAPKAPVTTIEALFRSIAESSCEDLKQIQAKQSYKFDPDEGFPSLYRFSGTGDLSTYGSSSEIVCVAIGAPEDAACPLPNEPGQGDMMSVDEDPQRE